MNSGLIKAIKSLLFVIPIVSMVVISDMHFPFITGKSFLFRILVELAFGLYIALAFADKTYRPVCGWLLKSFTAFVVIMFVADISALNPARAIWSNFERMEGFVLLAHLYVYFIVLSSVLREKKDWVYMLLSSIAVSVFMTFFAFLQLFGGAVINQGGVRLDGTLGNSSYMATYMVFHIFFLCFIWVMRGNRVKGIADAVLAGTFIYIVFYLWRINVIGDIAFSVPGGIILAFSLLTGLKLCWFRFSDRFAGLQKLFVISLYLFLIGAQTVVLYYTATRGAILGLLGGTIISTALLLLKSRENKLFRNIAATVLIGVTLFVAIFIIFRKSDFIQESPVLNRFANISLNDTSQARAIIWPMAIEAVGEHPILGWGQDNFIYAFAKYYKPEMIRHEAWFDRTHNVFLDWLVAGGLLGFIAYLGLYIFALINIFKNTVFNYAEKTILTGLLAAYAFLSLFIFDNLTSYYLSIVLLGLTTLSVRQESKKSDVEKVDAGILFAILGLTIILSLLLNWGPIKQNFDLSDALRPQKEGYNKNLDYIKDAVNGGAAGRFESMGQMIGLTQSIISAPNIPDDDKSKFALETFNSFNAYIKIYPNDVLAYYMLGSFLTDVGLYNDAIPLLEKAQVLSPKKQQIYYSLAKAYFIKADREKKNEFIDTGLSYLKTAYEFAPHMGGPRDMYINALVATDRLDEIRGVLSNFSDTDEAMNSNLEPILRQKGLLK